MTTIIMLLGIGCLGVAYWGHETDRLELLALAPAGAGFLFYAASQLK